MFFVSFKSFSKSMSLFLHANFSKTLELIKISGEYRPSDCGKCSENGKGFVVPLT